MLVSCCPAAPHITVPPGNQTVLAGTTVGFSCTTEAEPSPAFLWTLNGDTTAGREGFNIYAALSCRVTGFPILEVTWTKEGGPLPDTTVESNGLTVDSTLYLSRLDVNDSASYTCRAVNNLASMQEVESAPGYLQVECKLNPSASCEVP